MILNLIYKSLGNFYYSFSPALNANFFKYDEKPFDTGCFSSYYLILILKFSLMATPQSVSAPAATAMPAGGGEAAPKKGNNALVIILVILGLLLLCCGGGALAAYLLTKRAADELTNQLANPTAISGFVQDILENSLSDEDTQTTFGKLVSDWPSDVPLMANAEILYSGSQKETDKTVFSTSYSVNATTSDVENFYKNKMSENSWTLNSEDTLFGFTLSYKKGVREAFVYVLEGEAGKTTVSLTVDQ